MTIGDHGKLIIIVTILIGVFASLAIHAISSDAAIPIVTTVLGYLIGNGRVAYNGQAPVPVLVPRKIVLPSDPPPPDPVP